MKIVTRKEFLKLPAETLFSYYEPCSFADLHIKVSDKNSGYDNDFLYDSIIGPIFCQNSEDFTNKCDEMEKGKSVKLDFEYTRREGLFEDEQLFAIYEKDDVIQLITRLNKLL